MAPEDPSPHSNLSAAHYEMGLYAQCIEDIDTALGLDKNKSSALEQKLVPRLVKSYLQVNDPKAAVDALNRVSESGDKAVMEFVCRRLANSSLPKEHKYRRDRLQQLPRYLPSLDPVREYYVVGHDEACSQIDASMLDQSDRSVSILFGGIGDARNMYATLLKVDQLEREFLRLPTRKYHLTINDIKPETLARDLLMFFLNDLGRIKELGENKRRDILTTISSFTLHLWCHNAYPDTYKSPLSEWSLRYNQAMEFLHGSTYMSETRYCCSRLLIPGMAA